MSNLNVTATFKIYDTNVNEFKELAAQCLIAVKANEPGNLQYDWYFNADHTVCVVNETYTDTDAVFAHVGNVGELLGKLGQISDLCVEVFGDPSQELRKVIYDMNGKLYSFYQGL